eukprot:1555021-Heterocapsa_arctica.AAC.1
MIEEQKRVSYWYEKEMCLATSRTLTTRTPRRRAKEKIGREAGVGLGGLQTHSSRRPDGHGTR